MSVRTGSESDRITRSVIRNKNYRQLIRSLPLSVLLCLKSQCLIHTGLQPGVGRRKRLRNRFNGFLAATVELTC